MQEKHEFDEDQLGLGILTTLFAENDLDIVYILDNTLHIVECKTRMNKQMFDNTLYKSGALKEKFGLGVKSYIFTLEDLNLLNEHQRESIYLRALQQNIEIKDKNKIIDFENW